MGKPELSDMQMPPTSKQSSAIGGTGCFPTDPKRLIWLQFLSTIIARKYAAASTQLPSIKRQ
jgi:hypothetical protein